MANDITYSGKNQVEDPPILNDHLRSLGTLAMGGARALLSTVLLVGSPPRKILNIFRDIADPFHLFGGVDDILFTEFKGQLDFLEENRDLALQYQGINQQDFDFWDRGVIASKYTTDIGADDRFILKPITPTAPPGTFQGYRPYMEMALNEAKGRPYYTSQFPVSMYGALDYLASTGRGQSKASLHHDAEWLNTRRKVGRYNVGHGRRVDYKYATARLNAELEGWNLGFRFEDHRKMMYDEQRHKHQADILNLGIGVGLAARRGLATSVKGLSEARAQKAGSLGALSNGLSTYSGFTDTTNRIEDRQRQRASEKKDYGDYMKGLIKSDSSNDRIMKSGMESENG